MWRYVSSLRTEQECADPGGGGLLPYISYTVCAIVKETVSRSLVSDRV